jgi:RNA polymerase sigma factor (TIGR02999 family)
MTLSERAFASNSYIGKGAGNSSTYLRLMVFYPYSATKGDEKGAALEQSDFSRLLLEARDGERSLDSFIAAVYTELKRIAASLMSGRVNGRTLQPTALVNEAWLRLAAGDSKWDSKAHFFGAAARAMRQVLIEEARRRSSQKRAGGAKRVTLRDLDIKAEEPDVDLLSLDEALAALADADQHLARMVELRYFAGCSLEEVAGLMGRSLAAVKRDWTYARAWLFDRMSAGGIR